MCDCQDGEAAVETVRREDHRIMLRDAMDEYNNSFILK